MAFILWPLLLLAVALGGYWLWDRHRYTGARGEDGSFRPTDEVFVDPSTGRRMRVFYDSRTGRRTYREDPNP